MFFVDFKGYEEYIKLNDIDYILNNLYLEILYNNNDKKEIHLNLNKSFSNNKLFFTKSPEVSDGENTKNEDTNLIAIRKKIESKFKKDNDLYTLEINDINFVYFEEANLLIMRIENDNYYQAWTYNLNTNLLDYTELVDNELVNSFKYNDGKTTCDLEKCYDTKKLVDKFYDGLELIL